MHRTRTYTLVFALAATLVTVAAAVLTYQSLRSAFEGEFRARLARVAGIAASQVAPRTLADLRSLGAEGGGFLEVQAQLDVLCAVTGFEDFQLLDTTRTVLYDVRRGEEGFGAQSAWDTLAPGALGTALAGKAAPSPPIQRDGIDVRAAFQPLTSDGRVIAVLVAEARPEWESDLRRLRQRLTAVGLVSVVAIAVLAGLLVRLTGRQLSLERRLARSDNLAAMGRLTATLAHEIKNPLAIIRGSAKRLARLDPESQRMADSVVEEVDRLGRTVTRYLQFARGDGGEAGEGDLAAALVATLELLAGEAEVRRCTIERSGDLEPGALVPLDPESLRQVCLNLLLNALEASPEGGRVRVSLARSAAHVALTVADDGPGMPAEVLQRLGEPFFSTKAQGTGLGLFLSRRLVEGAGGRLEVASRTGEGTSVTVSFRPARPNGRPAADG